MQCIIDVRRQIDQADTRQPTSDGRTEIVAVLHDESDADSERKYKLKQATAENHHELAERPEQHMPRFVYRQQDIVHKGRAYLTITVVIPEQEPTPNHQQYERGATSVKRHRIHLLQRLQQRCDVTLFGTGG